MYVYKYTKYVHAHKIHSSEKHLKQQKLVLYMPSVTL